MPQIIINYQRAEVENLRIIPRGGLACQRHLTIVFQDAGRPGTNCHINTPHNNTIPKRVLFLFSVDSSSHLRLLFFFKTRQTNEKIISVNVHYLEDKLKVEIKLFFFSIENLLILAYGSGRAAGAARSAARRALSPAMKSG